jgi:hypothetical protein
MKKASWTFTKDQMPPEHQNIVFYAPEYGVEFNVLGLFAGYFASGRFYANGGYIEAGKVDRWLLLPLIKWEK